VHENGLRLAHREALDVERGVDRVWQRNRAVQLQPLSKLTKMHA
jgi:hypothetical protein